VKRTNAERLQFGRVTLRPAERGDETTVALWFAETWRDVRGLTSRAAAAPPEPDAWFANTAGGETALLIEVEGQPVGFVRFGVVGRECVLRELGVRPDRRNLGFGSEAVFAIEQQALRAGVTCGVAPVPLANGLAIYFWLRIGYCPRYPGGDPPAGFTLMARDLGAPPAAAPESGSRTAAPRSGGRAPRPSPPPRQPQAG
jgi:GNAT superfamily N-acetyltransferase